MSEKETPKWTRNCPKCGKLLTYSTKQGIDIAISRGSFCTSCCKMGDRNPFYGKTHGDTAKRIISEANTGNVPWNSGLTKEDDDRLLTISGKVSDTLRLKYTTGEYVPWNSGSVGVYTGETLDKMSERATVRFSDPRNHPMFGKTHTEESIRKMRLSRISEIENKYGVVAPNFNPTACQLIDEYGKEHGFNFQHAMNGGEFHITDLGYFVDGYDEEKNVVIEYYEMAHKRTKKRDARRKREIVEHLGCEFIELTEWD